MVLPSRLVKRESGSIAAALDKGISLSVRLPVAIVVASKVALDRVQLYIPIHFEPFDVERKGFIALANVSFAGAFFVQTIDSFSVIIIINISIIIVKIMPVTLD